MVEAKDYAWRVKQSLEPDDEQAELERFNAWLNMLRVCRDLVPAYAYFTDFYWSWHMGLYENYKRQNKQRGMDIEKRWIDKMTANKAIWAELSAMLDAYEVNDIEAAHTALSRALDAADEHNGQIHDFIFTIHDHQPQYRSPEYRHYCKVFGFPHHG